MSSEGVSGISRRRFLHLGAVGSAAASLAWPVQRRKGAAPDRGPNIVFILADDLGWGDLSCYGATKVQTPHIDRIAREGIRFTDAHSPSSVCTPSRYNLLTGRYCWRTWAKTGCVWANDPLLIEEDRMTVASLLKSAGYATGCVGKWHLGFGRPGPQWDDILGPDFNEPLKPGPLEVGFNYFFGMVAVGQRPHVFIENHRVAGLDKSNPMRTIPDKRPEFMKNYLERPRTVNPVLEFEGGAGAVYRQEDVALTLAAKAVSFIEQNARNEFFLYFAPRNIHGPRVPNPRFKGTSQCGVYGDFIKELDWSAGEVLGTLDRLGLAGSTLVILSSDNGAVSLAEQFGHRSNGSFRGEKSDVWEGGHRVPFVARWPGNIRAGARSDQTISLTDMLATFAAVLNVKLPDEAGPDSFNMLPVLRGQAGRTPVREAIVHDSWKGLFAIRQGPWKLILGQGGGGLNSERPSGKGDGPPGQLYNLAADLGETTNLYLEQPEIVQRLTALFEKYRERGRSR